MSSELILFDLPSKDHCECWSLNPWKTRAALNFKGIPYKTEWTEYPDVAPKFKAAGLPSNDLSKVTFPYSIPVVRLPDGRYVMESRAIVSELEKLQSSPSLYLDNGYLDRTQDVVTNVSRGLAANMMPLIPDRLLNEPSAKYFHETRTKLFGMTLPELAKSDKAGEATWIAVEPAIAELKKLLNENKGPYISGEQVSYADLIAGGLWKFLQRLDPDGLYKRLASSDPAIDKHWQAVKKYFERGDH